mmetsp:Transcript_12196/g.20707  ORF Transcript_12196/g.20707 Transcript_12196/m.20707 type:complete len:185 (+) Transcript_12196:325-879(+)
MSTSPAPSPPPHGSMFRGAMDVTVTALPWGGELDPSKDWWAAPGAVDLVIASDILYSLPGKQILFRELADTLKQLLRDPVEGVPGDKISMEAAETSIGDLVLSPRVAVFSYQHRSGDERLFFEDVLPAEGFVCKDVTGVAVAMGAGVSFAEGAVCSPQSAGGMMRGLIRLVEVQLASTETRSTL